MTRFQRGGTRGKGGCQPNEAVVVSAMDEIAKSRVYSYKARDTNWEGGGRCLGSLGGGTEYFAAFVCL